MRIVRMQEREDGNLLDVLLNRVGNSVDEDTANAIIIHLTDLKLITQNEAALMRSAVSRNALSLPVSAKDVLRAAVLKVNFGFFGNGGFNAFLGNLNGVTTSLA